MHSTSRKRKITASYPTLSTFQTKYILNITSEFLLRGFKIEIIVPGIIIYDLHGPFVSRNRALSFSNSKISGLKFRSLECEVSDQKKNLTVPYSQFSPFTYLFCKHHCFTLTLHRLPQLSLKCTLHLDILLILTCFPPQRFYLIVPISLKYFFPWRTLLLHVPFFLDVPFFLNVLVFLTYFSPRCTSPLDVPTSSTYLLPRRTFLRRIFPPRRTFPTTCNLPRRTFPRDVYSPSTYPFPGRTLLYDVYSTSTYPFATCFSRDV